ncbi:MAG: hypothetical protein B6241_07630 [Spirochaetaceae bacterium 4572_59]|nr:MAG: hypothetical protein B6241_07630 [Spirochaetaceae bacterium 4572_59]
MAGIGFELRKVASLGSARGLFQASLSGIMIVAGPWLISILTILVFQQPVLGIPLEFRRLFVASTIYIYASSLIFSGGFHYIFTRILSDYIFRNEMNKAMGLTIRFLSLSTLVLIPAAWFLQKTFLNNPGISDIHKGSFILLFVVINHIWVLMLTASAIKKYNQLLLVYLTGMGSSLFFMKAAISWFNSSYLLLGYTMGQLLLMILLFFFLIKQMGYTKTLISKDFFHYIRRYRALFISGFFYYGALWIDKMIFWVYRGEVISGTGMKLYESYDIIVYLTNLMMIPGLVFFVIFSETEFYLSLKRFLDSLSRKPFKHIKTNQYILRKTTRFILQEQAALQGCVTLIFICVAWFRPEMRIHYPMVVVSSVNIMVLGLFLTVMNFLFYIEQYWHAFKGVIVFFCINTAGALLSPLCPFFSLPGVSTLTGCLAGLILMTLYLFISLRSLDRIIYTSITDARLKDIQEKNRK